MDTLIGLIVGVVCAAAVLMALQFAFVIIAGAAAAFAAIMLLWFLGAVIREAYHAARNR